MTQSRQRKGGVAALSSACALLSLTVACLVLTAANLNLRSSYARAVDNLSRSQAAVQDLALGFIPARRTLVVPPEAEAAAAGVERYGQGRYQERGQAAFMFVQFNALQISPTTFAVLGLTPGVMQNVSRSAVDGCEWQYPGSLLLRGNASQGSLLRAKVNRWRQVWFGETYRLTYSPLLVHCRFPEAVNRDWGGKLFLNVSTFSPLEGDHIRVEALDAPPGALPPSFRPPFRFQYAFCSPPVHGNVSAGVVRQWLAYHFALFQGKAHFFMYDAGGVSPQLLRVFRSYEREGALSVVDVRRSGRYEAWYHHQVLAINDCLYRARSLARWALHFDLDEYLLPNPPHTLGSILEEHSGVPWITFGSMPHNTKLCARQEGAEEEEQWEIEKAALRRWRPECWHPRDGEFVCLGAHGRRKYAADPRKVMNGGIHRVLAPEEGGVHLSHRVAAFHHYRGTLSSDNEMCSRGRFRVSTMRAWVAAMEESRQGALVPMPGVEEEPWRTELPEVLDEAMLEQARVAKAFAKHHLQLQLQLQASS